VVLQMQRFNSDLLTGYMVEPEMAEARHKKPRTLRLERQRGDGPPWVRDGRTILYPIDGFREWLKARERHPVRERAPP
jgi:hypothetical protein